MEQNQPIPKQQTEIPPTIAGTQESVPRSASKAGHGSGESVIEMAQRDLDAALQLLAYRAQYITGASGAAIALRREGRNDMLCRATTGASAPELGALLSAEFGLSGESVRTRKLLRCDDAERDARVNPVTCRKLGIASVVVMPVVNDDEVLGVFEIFSGKANAFGEHDLSAVERLSRMVETAVRLARAAVASPDQLPMPEIPTAALTPSSVEVAEEIADEEIFADTEVKPAVRLREEVTAEPPASDAAAVPHQAERVIPAGAQALPVAHPAKKLFWSATPVAEPTPGKPAEADQSHVPPVLRSLRKCEVCGFPITAGRALCVECEEKKWRGQLRRPPAPLR